MADGARSLRGGSPASSPVLGGRGRSAGAAAAGGSSPPGHSFRRVTLTKPTFCHYCTDFIWGLAGYQCEGKGAAGRDGGRGQPAGERGRAGRRAGWGGCGSCGTCWERPPRPGRDGAGGEKRRKIIRIKITKLQ